MKPKTSRRNKIIETREKINKTKDIKPKEKNQQNEKLLYLKYQKINEIWARLSNRKEREIQITKIRSECEDSVSDLSEIKISDYKGIQCWMFYHWSPGIQQNNKSRKQ